MVERSRHSVDALDEQRHEPAADELWNESYYADFVNDDGRIAGYIRLGLYPNLGVSWWTAMIVGPDRPTVAAVGYELPVPAERGLAVAAEGFDVACRIDDPLVRFGVSAKTIGASYADPSTIYEGDPGVPTDVEMDLSWHTDGSPYHYELTTRYEVPCLIEGSVRVGDASFAIKGPGQRDHSWGVRDWWAIGWCWAAARLDDGTRVHIADIRIPGSPVPFGYVQTPGGEVTTVRTLEVTEALGSAGFPDSGRIALEPGGLVLDVEPIAFGPLLLTSTDGRVSRFPRAAARFRCADGRAGTGWIEWNQVQAPS